MLGPIASDAELIYPFDEWGKYDGKLDSCFASEANWLFPVAYFTFRKLTQIKNTQNASYIDVYDSSVVFSDKGNRNCVCY